MPTYISVPAREGPVLRSQATLLARRLIRIIRLIDREATERLITEDDLKHIYDELKRHGLTQTALGLELDRARDTVKALDRRQAAIKAASNSSVYD